MKNIALGYIGSGPISNFHIPAIKKVGFKIKLFYSRNYSKACIFSKVNKIALPERSFEDFLRKSHSVDGFVLCIKTNATGKYLEKLCTLNKPIFVEKPGSLHSLELRKIKKKANSSVYFLYNRRFYPSITEGRRFIERSKCCFASVKIPESVKTIYQFITNGCHVIDLLIFYFGNLKLIKSFRLKKNIGFYFTLQSENKGLISCLLNWGSPQNFEINVFNEKNQRMEIKPIENSFFYDKMEKIEPTKKNPIRFYIPELKKKKSSIYEGMKYKPGFIEQYKDVKKIIQSKKHKYKLCDLDGAIKVLDLIETIIKKATIK
jgi:hypothetical protein